MSNKLLTAVWDHAPYDGGALLVLLALADQASDEGVAWPSMATIAQKARMNVRNARRHVRRLRNDGAVIQYERRGTSFVYVVRTPQPAQTLPYEDAPVTCDLPAWLTPVPPVTSDLPPRSPVTAKPLREPIVNPKRTGRDSTDTQLEAPEPAIGEYPGGMPAWKRTKTAAEYMARQGLATRTQHGNDYTSNWLIGYRWWCREQLEPAGVG